MSGPCPLFKPPFLSPAGDRDAHTHTCTLSHIHSLSDARVYACRSFSFASMVLENKKQAEEPGVPAGTWDGAEKLVVERVVFLGLPKGVASFTAVLPGGKEVLLERGPVSAQGAKEAPEGGWILRRPNLPVDQDWSVRVVSLNH